MKINKEDKDNNVFNDFESNREEFKKEKHNNKKIILLLFLFVIIVVMAVIIGELVYSSSKKYINVNSKIITYGLWDEFGIIGTDSHERNGDTELFLVNSYSDYKKILDKVEGILVLDEEGLNSTSFPKYDKSFFEKNSLLLVESLYLGGVIYNPEVINVYSINHKLTVNISLHAGGDVVGTDGVMFIIALPKDEIKNITNIDVKVNNTYYKNKERRYIL